MVTMNEVFEKFVKTKIILRLLLCNYNIVIKELNDYLWKNFLLRV